MIQRIVPSLRTHFACNKLTLLLHNACASQRRVFVRLLTRVDLSQPGSDCFTLVELREKGARTGGVR